MTVVSLAVLDTYRVKWSRETVARDVVQNFFDAAESVDEIKIEIDDESSRIRITGGSEFAFDYLRYIGATTKADPALRTAGGFGEGFKICALVLLRDFGVRLSAGSGPWTLRAFFKPTRVGNELSYDVTEEDPHSGSWVEIERADKKLRDAFRQSLDWFHHAKNPKLQKPFFADEAKGIGIYLAMDPAKGEVFYRKQIRGRLGFPRGAGLSFAFHDRIDVLEGDRDRRDLANLRPILVETARRLPDEVLERLVFHLRPYWSRGGRVLSAILSIAAGRKLRLKFPKRWVARSSGIQEIEEYADRMGAHLGIAGLAKLGMPRVIERFGIATKTRLPTALEAERISVARHLYQDLAGKPPPRARSLVVDAPNTTRIHNYGSDHVVSAELLQQSFDLAIADCLGTLAKSASFSDRSGDAEQLTILLEGALRSRAKIEAARLAWDSATGALAPAVESLEPSHSLQVRVLAPSQFPPFEGMAENIRVVARKLGIPVKVTLSAIDDVRAAMFAGVRGLPAIEIHRSVVDRGSKSTPAFSIRTYKDGIGLWLPSEAKLTLALERGWKIESRPRPRSKPRSRYRVGSPAAAMKWLKEVDIEEWRDTALKDAFFELRMNHDNWPRMWPHDFRVVAEALVTRDLRESDELPLIRVSEALERRRATIAEMLAALEGHCLVPLEQRSFLAYHHVSEMMAVVAKQGGSEVEILEAGKCRVGPFVAIETARHIELDRYCANVAISLSIEVAESRLADGVDEAVRAGKETLDKLVEFGQATHRELESKGLPLDCFGTSREAFRRFLGLPKPEPLNAPQLCGPAVKAAWQLALDEGTDELEAARRCLVAAEKASAEERAFWKRRESQHG